MRNVGFSSSVRSASDDGGCFNASLILSSETGRLDVLSCAADGGCSAEDGGASCAEAGATATIAVNSRANNRIRLRTPRPGCRPPAPDLHDSARLGPGRPAFSFEQMQSVRQE